jgi:outer membrane protein
VKFLESLHADMQEKINAIQERLTQKPDDEAAQKELQSVYMASQQRMQTEQQHVISLLDDVIQRVINTCREQKGYDVIINAEVTAAFSSAVDVTTEIIAEVNKHPLEFKPAADESARNDPSAAKTPGEAPATAPK